MSANQNQVPAIINQQIEIYMILGDEILRIEVALAKDNCRYSSKDYSYTFVKTTSMIFDFYSYNLFKLLYAKFLHSISILFKPYLQKFLKPVCSFEKAT